MVDHSFEISTVVDVKCFNREKTTIVVTKKCRVEQRRYGSRHLILMNSGTHCKQMYFANYFVLTEARNKLIVDIKCSGL